MSKSDHPSKIGIWFASTPEAAKVIARAGSGDSPRLITARLRLDSPKQYQTYADFLSDYRDTNSDVALMRRRLMRKGHDGIEITRSDTDQGGLRTDWAVFDKHQIEIEDSKSLSEAGMTVYPREPPKADASGQFIQTVETAFTGHQVSKYVDVTLTVKSPTLVEITFMETEQQRRKGHAGAVLDMLTAAADTFQVTIQLQAFFATGTGARRVLAQDQLEAFYGRRGFRIVDDGQKERWMIRQPA